MHPSINRFFIFSLLVLFFNPKGMLPLLSSSSEGKVFELHSLPHGYLTFMGDSHLVYDGIALTKVGMPTNAPSRSTGIVLYNRPILFLDPHSKKVPSFSTMFAFSIEKIYGVEEASGDGLAFFISPNSNFLGSPGYFGLVDSKNLTRNEFIAIEFDTKYDPMFQDPDDNHLGLDINSLSSVQLATSSTFGVNFKSGNVIKTWIDYKSDEKSLEVFLINSNLKREKPKMPLWKVDIDLSDYLEENMFVGFSAATEGSMQLTRIEQWEFSILEFIPPPPPPSSASLESGRTFPNPSASEYGHSHLSRLTMGLIVGVCFVPSVLVCWFCWKKLMGMIQKQEGPNNQKMQTIRSSEGKCQEIRLSILDTNRDEIARGLTIEKVLENEAEVIRVKIVEPSTPLHSCENSGT